MRHDSGRIEIGQQTLRTVTTATAEDRLNGWISKESVEFCGPCSIASGQIIVLLKEARGVVYTKAEGLQDLDPSVEFLRVVYQPGSESCPEDSLVRHGGKEYGYVISGRLGVTVGFDTYELGAGDSISFDSTEPHRLAALGDEPVCAIWSVVGRKADPRV